jgi:hypothetical protein
LSTFEDGSGNLHELTFLAATHNFSFYAVSNVGSDRLIFLQTALEVIKQELAGLRRELSSDEVMKTSRPKPGLDLEKRLLMLSEPDQLKLAFASMKLHKLIDEGLPEIVTRKVDTFLQYQPELVNEPFDARTFDIIFRVLVECLKGGSSPS